MSKVAKSNSNVRGFFRLQIMEDGKVAGDSGWKENMITQRGFENFIIGPMIASNSSRVNYANLGEGAAPASNADALPSEITDVSNVRASVTPTYLTSEAAATHIAQYAFTINSNVYNTTHAIANVGLFANSATATGSQLMAGNTFTSSALATNQSVNGTYQIRFGRA